MTIGFLDSTPNRRELLYAVSFLLEKLVPNRFIKKKKAQANACAF